MTKTAEGTVEDTTAYLAALRQDIARLSESVSALLQNPAPGVGQHVSDAVEDAKVKMQRPSFPVQRLTSSPVSMWPAERLRPASNAIRSRPCSSRSVWEWRSA